MDRATIQGALQGIRSRAEFQAKFFGPAIQSLINTTTDGITVSGMELVDKNTSYIFMSNHRVSFLIRPPECTFASTW